MRLLFVSTLYPSSLQPTRAMFNFHHVQAISRLGHEVAVLAPTKCIPGAAMIGRGSRLPAFETYNERPVWHPRFHPIPVLGRHLQHVAYRRQVRSVFRKIVAEFSPDHILIGFAYPDGAAVGPLCDEVGLPWSVAVLGSDFNVRIGQRFIGRTVRDTLQRAPIVFCPGRALKQAMAAVGVDERKIVSFRNGVERSIFQPGPVQREDYVLFVGNFMPVKRVHLLVEAWGRLARPDLELRLVGGGPLEGQLRQLADDIGIANRVKIMGRMSPQEIARQMQHARLLCLPSRSEGMPNVVLEALACGTPVVGSPAGEIPHIIKPGQNGFVFSNEGDPAQNLAGALASGLDHPWDQPRIVESVADCSWEMAARIVIDTVS